MPWAPNYATIAQLKSQLRIPAADTQDDAELTAAVVAASRAVDHATNRQFGSVAAGEVRLYTARWDRHMRRHVVDIDDLMSTTDLAVAADDDDDGVYDDETWTLNTSDGFFLAPANAPDVARPWVRIVFRTDADTPPLVADAIQVTARWGWTAVPATIEAATLLQAERFFYRRNAPFGVAGSPDTGSELRLLAKIDPDVAVMVRSYIRWWGAA